MPYVKWRLGAVELTPEDEVPIGRNVLSLNDVRESTNYTCVASSELGNIEDVAHVKVKGSVTPPTPSNSLTPLINKCVSKACCNPVLSW